MMSYSEDDYLDVSGIQHFVFSERQWALIYVEGQWKDNYLTLAGDHFHKKVDDPYVSETRGSKFIKRALKICSKELGLSGICDVVEFQKDDKNGVPVYGKECKYLPIPVEYKHGKPKKDKSDIFQVLAEAICLEEMMLCHIGYGYLYYGKTRHREKVVFTNQLRKELKEIVKRMHYDYERGYTPKTKNSRKFRSSSLKDIGLPEMFDRENVKNYISRKINE